MAAHATEHPTTESSTGAGLLPIFAIATIIGIVVIGVLLASPSTVAVVAALATVVGFAAGLSVLVSRLIGGEDH